ncbi:chondrolectin isoform X1 [Erpetoichthys calabaricus]|uniref:chondrolectin isoform X1 n=1 Tax=Erpetoichthys calabaricus TaxID=27687 RepID=UPI0010A076A9|nr:chondrolectin isoform X1 [Erpetoichthys calabaricus]
MNPLLKLIPLLCGLLSKVHICYGTRVVSGQTVCYGGPKHPCYKIAYFQDMSSRVAFKEAKNACEIDGGTLLSIENETEQKLIEKLLHDLTSSGSGVSDGDFWIGLTRNGDGGAQTTFAACSELYKWTDGSVSEFRNWYYDEPSCGGEACVVMYHQPTAQHGLGGPYLYQWNDDRCNMKHNFICKYEPESVLEKELGDRAEPEYEISTSREPTQQDESGKIEEDAQVVAAKSSGLLLVYVIIPTIPLLLLILVASGTCCFQMLTKNKPRTKTSVDQSTLWITKAPKKENSMEV